MGTAGRKWVGLPADVALQIQEYLVREGGHDSGQAVGPSEGWRVRLSDATFTYYRSGTLYSTASAAPRPCS